MSHYIRLMRPHQWIKNLVVLAGPAFGLEFADFRVVVVLAAFCLMSSASYAINDIFDREADRTHPEKRERPIASGAVPVGAAWLFAGLLAVAAVCMTYTLLQPAVTLLVAGYFVLILAYSSSLKQRPILDVIIIAVGFVMRAVAGAQAVDAFVSPWLIACTFTLCMFLGFGKRRCELATLRSDADRVKHRATLLRYTPELLTHLISVSAGIAIVTFLLYTMDANPNIPHPPFHKEYLLYTLPLVAYGFFRYAMLIETGRFTGPMQIVLKDKALLLTGFLWAASAAGIILTTRDQHAVAATSASTAVAGTGQFAGQ